METKNFFLGRQPILDRNQAIFGYELLFRSADVACAEVTDFSLASASVIMDAMSTFGFREVLGQHRGFINVDAQMLLSDMIELLPKEQVILELLENIELDAAVVERCRELKAKGFSLALDDHEYQAAYEPLYGLVDVVKVDLLKTPHARIGWELERFRQWPVRLLAEKVESREAFQSCYELGFQMFQGYYFARPEVLQKKRVDMSGLSLLRLLNQISAMEEIDAIEETFRQNPTMAFNLLKLVNSVHVGVRERIKTLRHAIVVLGRQQLLRWTHLAMFACGSTDGGTVPLLELSATRGKLLELLVQRYLPRNGDDDYHERAFMTGILSLTDVLFEVPMEEVVCQLHLAEDVSTALLDRDGELGRLLCLAETLERTDFAMLPQQLGMMRLSHGQLLNAQMAAMNWSQGLVASAAASL